jgi:hypothetical protein
MVNTSSALNIFILCWTWILQGFHLVLYVLQLTLVELSIAFKFKVTDAKTNLVYNFNDAQQSNFWNTVYHTYHAHWSSWLLSDDQEFPAYLFVLTIVVMLQKIQAALAAQ